METNSLLLLVIVLLIVVIGFLVAVLKRQEKAHKGSRDLVVPPKTEIIPEDDFFPVNPLAEFDRLQNRIDKVFGDLTSGFSNFSSIPAMDFEDRGKTYKATVNIPGSEEADIKAEVKDGYLNIEAQTGYSNESNKDNFLRKERYYGCFRRSMRLPNDASDKISKDYKNGVLKISIDKK